MREEIVKCDVCKRVKGEENKWIPVVLLNTGATILIGPMDEQFIHNFYQVGIEVFAKKDLCSEACLQIELGKVLEKIRKDKHNALPK